MTLPQRRLEVLIKNLDCHRWYFLWIIIFINIRTAISVAAKNAKPQWRTAPRISFACSADRKLSIIISRSSEYRMRDHHRMTKKQHQEKRFMDDKKTGIIYFFLFFRKKVFSVAWWIFVFVENDCRFVSFYWKMIMVEFDFLISKTLPFPQCFRNHSIRKNVSNYSFLYLKSLYSYISLLFFPFLFLNAYSNGSKFRRPIKAKA